MSFEYRGSIQSFVRTWRGVQGIQYEIKKGIKRDEWVWIIHTPEAREGRIIGSRIASSARGLHCK
jgi:hypothetical protein